RVARHEDRLTVGEYREALDHVALHLDESVGAVLDVKDGTLSVSLLVVLRVEAEVRTIGAAFAVAAEERSPSGPRAERRVEHDESTLLLSLVEIAAHVVRDLVDVHVQVVERRGGRARIADAGERGVRRPRAASADALKRDCHR